MVLFGRAVTGDLGANPVEELTHRSGDWALRFLLLTLAVTPARNLLRWSLLLRYRRMLGLFAFAYALTHFLIWLILGQSLMWPEIFRDLIGRPYVAVGMLAFVLLIPLAATSAAAMRRRLGATWKQLHRLVYLSAALGVVHFFWLTKADWSEPAAYAMVLAVLLVLRVRRQPARRETE